MKHIKAKNINKTTYMLEASSSGINTVLEYSLFLGSHISNTNKNKITIAQAYTINNTKAKY